MQLLLMFLPLLAAITGGSILLSLFFRRVVPTNQLHVVQSSRSRKLYGTLSTGSSGNTYYSWPSWLPMVGVVVSKFPTSNFTVKLEDFEAFDEGRLQFAVDISSVFRIDNFQLAASRVASMQELLDQLELLVQGGIRSVLASRDLNEIMQSRGSLGEAFSREVDPNLEAWGVVSIRNIELMDIRDSGDSHAIRDIMSKKKSLIDMESRTTVAANNQKAKEAEIASKKAVDLADQDAIREVGMRTTETKKDIALANQKMEQQVKTEELTTKKKQLEIQQYETVKKAEIDRDANIVEANREKETAIIIADGQLEVNKKEAEGVKVQGEAAARAKELDLLAPVNAQTTLAEKIGSNKEYQAYMVQIEQVKASIEIGKAQASALEKSSIKIIANSGDISGGIKNVTDMFSSKGGTQAGAFLEGLSNTEVGAKLLETVGLKPDSVKPDAQS